MALAIVHARSVLNNAHQATVVVQGANPTEVNSTDAKSLALSKAAELGLSRPGLGSQSGPYPVDENGMSDDDVIHARNGKTVAAYQQEFKCRGI